jgi:predicted ATP-dependent endonuclease of OLD family
MKKIAFFVEGQTEQIFVSELLNQLFGEHKKMIVMHKMRKQHHNISLETFTSDEPKEYFVMIYDCGTDAKVKSDILDNYQKLYESGFNYVIGLQDFFNPQRRKRGITVQQLKKGLNFGLEQIIPTEIFLAVQEIEAWIIAEEKHYEAVLPGFQLDSINTIAGINIQTDDSMTISHPAVTLDEIYKAGGRTSGYSKNEYIVKDIVGKLDFTNLYLNVRNRNESLNEFLTCLDGLIP